MALPATNNFVLTHGITRHLKTLLLGLSYPLSVGRGGQIELHLLECLRTLFMIPPPRSVCVYIFAQAALLSWNSLPIKSPPRNLTSKFLSNHYLLGKAELLSRVTLFLFYIHVAGLHISSIKLAMFFGSLKG